MEGQQQLPVKKRVHKYCDTCGQVIWSKEVSDSPTAVRMRLYRARKRQRLAQQEELNALVEDFLSDVAPLVCFEEMPADEELTEEYDDELQKLENKGDDDVY